MIESKHDSQDIDLPDPCVSAIAFALAAQSLPLLSNLLALCRGGH